jgi:hypothetical protein
MWAVTGAPLIISGNVRNMDPFVLQTYLNTEVCDEKSEGGVLEGQLTQA